MTINFSNFEKLKVSADMTASFPLDMIEGEASLLLAPATEVNREYYNALLKKSRSKMSSISAKKVNADTVKRNRNEDRELYGKYVLVGWTHVLDSEGNEVKFTKENGKQFLSSIPNWMFDQIRGFASDPQNFITTIDDEEVAGN